MELQPVRTTSDWDATCRSGLVWMTSTKNIQLSSKDSKLVLCLKFQIILPLIINHSSKSNPSILEKTVGWTANRLVQGMSINYLRSGTSSTNSEAISCHEQINEYCCLGYCALIQTNHNENRMRRAEATKLFKLHGKRSVRGF